MFSEQQHHKVLITDDEGDQAFQLAAPLILKGMHIIECMQALPQAARLSHRVQELYAFVNRYNRQHGINVSDRAPSHTIQRAVDDLSKQTKMLKPYLDSVMASFASIRGTPPSTEGSTPTVGGVRRQLDGGLIAPAELRLQDFLLAQPLYNYTHYYLFLTEFYKIVSDHVLFTACEPRTKILTSRYELHKSFNSGREESFLQGTNGNSCTRPDIKKAPKTDVRSLESFFSASSLVSFLEHIRTTQPDRVLRGGGPDGQGHSLTVEEVFRQFYGPSYATRRKSDGQNGSKHNREDDAFALTIEGLELRPDYADVGSSWSNLSSLPLLTVKDETANGGKPAGSRGTTDAALLLQYFLNLFLDGNNSSLLIDLVRHVLRGVRRQVYGADGVVMDKIELELTVTGRSNKELERMAEWCYHCGLIELEEEEGDHPSTDGDCKNKISDMVFISLRISQYAFEGKGDSAGADTSLEEGGLKLGQELWRTLMNDRLLDDGEDAEKLRADGDAQKETVAEHFGDILFNLFGPIWECIMNPQQHKPLAALLSRLVAFSISFDRSPEIQEMPVPSEFMTESEAKSKTQQGDGDGKRVYSPTHVNQYKVKGSFAPPDAFFAYHIWRNIHTINCFTSAHHFFWSGLRKNNNSNTSENGTKVNWGYDTLFSTQRSSSAREAKKSNVNETFDYEETQSEYTVDGGANRNNNNNNVNRKFMEAPAAFGSPFWSYFIPEHSVFRYYEPLFKNNSTLKFRIHGSNNSMLDNTSSGMVGNKDKTLFMEAVLGLLLADEIVNPYVAFEWSPMSYYYYLTQRCIMLSPSRNKKAPTLVRNTLLNKAIPMSVHLGLNSMIVTLEPLFYVSSNDALNEELEDLKKNYYLSTTDVNEMCLHGVEQRGRGTFYRSSLRPGAGPYLDEWYSWGIRCWPRTPYQMNHAQYTQVPSLRLYYRETALLHEVELLARWGIFRGATAQDGSTPHASLQFSDATLKTLFQQILEDQSFHKANSEKNKLLSAEAKVQLRRDNLFRLFFNMNNTLSINRNVVPEVRYGRLLVFFSMPFDFENKMLNLLARDKEEGGIEKSSGSYYKYKEAAVRYPRIVIAGPSVDEPSTTAKRLVSAMQNRHRYQAHMYHTNEADGVKRFTMPPANEQASKESAYSKVTAEAIRRSLPNEKRDKNVNLLDDYVRLPTKFALENGVFDVLLTTAEEKRSAETRAYFNQQYPSFDTYLRDIRELKALSSDMMTERYALRRLKMLENKFQLHTALTNDDQERFEVRLPSSEGEGRVLTFYPDRTQSGDLYQCVKVDVHCHMAGGMTARALLEFMKQKLKSNPDDIVDINPKTNEPVTLEALFREVLPASCQANGNGNGKKKGTISLNNVTIAALDVHAGKHTFNRFDQFNSRYSPMGVSSLRSVFLKTNNFMQGRYFAELIKQGCFQKQEEEGNVFSEYRLSIYGQRPEEWDELARWFVLHGMQHPTNKWVIQVPRLFGLYRRSGKLRNFQEMLSNIFAPLWEASIHPERHPFLHIFLANISAMDSVDNESDREGDQSVFVSPELWTAPHNPPFFYYMYYMWANLVTLNRYRSRRGLSTLKFRPHAGESGDPDHMAEVFLLADGIGHGINLMYRPVLQYLYYLAQIPLALVPLSNNSLFCKYEHNPLPLFFRRGLQVAIATDGALMFHRTEQPLVEEYSTAQNFWSLSNTDISELALNSILMSGFSDQQKRQWLGPLYSLRSIVGNDVRRSKVAHTRVTFRYEVYIEEIAYLQNRSAAEILNPAMLNPLRENILTLDLVGLTREEALSRNMRQKKMVERETNLSVVPREVNQNELTLSRGKL